MPHTAALPQALQGTEAISLHIVHGMQHLTQERSYVHCMTLYPAAWTSGRLATC